MPFRVSLEHRGGTLGAIFVDTCLDLSVNNFPSGFFETQNEAKGFKSDPKGSQSESQSLKNNETNTSVQETPQKLAGQSASKPTGQQDSEPPSP